MLSEYEKRELEKRKRLSERTRAKLQSDSTGSKGSLLRRMLQHSRKQIEKVAAKDQDLTKVKFRSMAEDEPNSANYTVSWSSLKLKLAEREGKQAVVDAVEDEKVESIEDVSRVHRAKLSRSKDVLVDDSHCQAIFGNVPRRGSGVRTSETPSASSHLESTFSKSLLRKGSLRRAGLGMITEGHLKQQASAEEIWEREREKEWTKSSHKQDDAESWGSSGSDSEKYVDIATKEYNQDLRAEDTQPSDNAAKPSTKWRERLLQRLKDKK